MKSGRPVYATGTGRLCPGCGWPAGDCRCSKAPEEPVPARVRATLRLERKGHSGKTVTLVEGLPNNRSFLEALAQELKKACGTGGRLHDHAVELQGDQRDRLRPLLAGRGWTVRG